MKICDKDVHSLHKSRERKRQEHEAQRGFGAQNINVAHVMRDVDDNSLKEELETSKHFLVDSQMKNGRRIVYNFSMDILYPKYPLEILNAAFDSLKCAATPNVAFGFVLRNVEDGRCTYYRAQENNTIMERSNLVATTEDFTKVKNLLSNTY